MKWIINFLFLLLSVTAIGQNVTIDYQAWNPSGTGCNLFVTATNVPATGTTSGTIEHQRKLGQTEYNSNDLSIQMQTDFQTTGSVSKGARYRIAYSFKSGYAYTIYVTTAAVENTVGFTTGPYIRADANNNGGGGSTGCNGPETLTPNTNGAFQLSSNSFQEIALAVGQPGVQSSLEITAFPAVNGGTKTVRIRKIRIVETAVSTPPSFTLPTTTSVQCASPTTFTVTTASNPNNLAITNYTWNLGATPNGWLYNGSAAPQTVSTGTSNTISLTRNSTASSVISATVTAGGNNYNTNNSTVTTSAPSLSITGPFNFCTQGTYTVANLPSGSSVSWSASPSGVVYFTNASGAQVTVNKSNAGIINLTATVTTPCGTYTVYSSSITVGVPVNGSVFTSPDQGLTLKSWAEGYNYIWEDSYVYWGLSGTSASQYSLVGGYVSWTSSNYFPNVEFYLGPGNYATFAVAVTSGGCSETLYYTFVPVSNPYNYYTLAPNPVSSDLTIYVDDEKLKNQKIEKSPDQVIQQVIIMDKLGNVLIQQNYPSNTRKVTLNVSGLTSDMFVAKIFNGKKWTTIKFMKK